MLAKEYQAIGKDKIERLANLSPIKGRNKSYKLDSVRGESNRNKSLFENVPLHMRDNSIGDEGEDCSTQAGHNAQRSYAEGNTHIMH
jgi:hypothetical protein